MTNVLIIGATGSIGQRVTKYFLDKTDDYLTLMARNTSVLSVDETRERTVQGDVIDNAPLNAALKDNEIVFMAVDSNLAQTTQRVVAAMEQHHIKRILFTTSMGIYNNVPVTDGASGNLTEELLGAYREAAGIIEDSDLNYTLIRPGNLDQGIDEDYLVNESDEDGDRDVSLNSVADFVIKLAADDKLGSRKSLSISRNLDAVTE